MSFIVIDIKNIYIYIYIYNCFFFDIKLYIYIYRYKIFLNFKCVYLYFIISKFNIFYFLEDILEF